MVPVDTRQQLLDDAEYVYSIDRAVYFNRKARKAFSIEFIEDHSPQELERCIREDTRTPEWTFYFNVAPGDSVRRELVYALE